MGALTSAAAELLRSRTMLFLVALTWLVALFGRDRVADWLEALGSEGILATLRAFAAVGGGPTP